MTTRLDRLFLLLDTGSTPVVRKSAADQLGEVQRLHPHELNTLLTKVHGYLRSSVWETRIAAGQAVEAIIKNVPQWDPPIVAKKEDSSASPLPFLGVIPLDQFNITKVLSQGASLLGSEGTEFDTDDACTGLDQKEKLSKQRLLLNKRLGLDVAGGLGLAGDNLFSDEDLVARRNQTGSPKTAGQGQEMVADVVQQLMVFSNPKMSAREKNRAKRKAKQIAKQRSKDVSEQNNGNDDSEPTAKLRRTTSVVVDQPADDSKIVVDNVPDSMLNMDDNEEWPFEDFCELLLTDLFSHAWETRHGAATGLREVIKLHGSGAGKVVDCTRDQLTAANQLWLQDVALRLLCVMALDRFGDYVSDEVVAPVRETCAQALGTVLHHMDSRGIRDVLQVLMQLLSQAQWEVRHGGLLGLKYLLAVRKDMTTELLPLVFPAIMVGLQDGVDDVCSVAAAALIPVTDTLVTVLPNEIPRMITCLWDTLLDLDDLTASTNSIMTLLCTLLANPQGMMSQISTQSLVELVPRLWPFMSHNIASVRQAALDTMLSLLQTDTATQWLTPILQDLLRHIYQRCLIEHKPEILEVVYKVWCAVLQKAPLDYVIAASAPWVGAWMCLMMQAAKLPFDANFLIQAKHRDKSTTPGKSRSHSDSEGTKHDKEYIGGYMTVSYPQEQRDIIVIRARMTAGRMLGLLCSYITKHVPNFPEGLERPQDSLAKLIVFHLSSKSALQRLSVGQIVLNWAKNEQGSEHCSKVVMDTILSCLNESIYFDEIALLFTRMQTECRDFVASLKQQNIDMDKYVQPGSILTPEQAQALVTSVFETEKKNLRPKHQQEFEHRRNLLAATISLTSFEQQTLAIRVQASLAGALTQLKALPDKLNPVVRPLMEAIKKESNQELQMQIAENLNHLLEQCVGRTPCPNPKIVKNLCTFLCSDPLFTPPVIQQGANSGLGGQNSVVSCSTFLGIITLVTQQKALDYRPAKRPGRKPANLNLELSPEMLAETSEAQKQLMIQRQGATFALTTIASRFGPQLLTRISNLWDTMLTVTSVIECNQKDLSHLKEDKNQAEQLIHSLQVLEIVGPSVHKQLQCKILATLPHLLKCLDHPYTTVRHMAARCLGMLSKVDTMETMNYILEDGLSLLGASDSETKRQGAVEAIVNIIDSLGVDVVPYIVLMVVPVLGRMSDQDEHVRLMATQCFANLIRLMPLEAGIPDPPKMKSSLIAQKERERKFLEQLLDGKKLESYQCSVPIKAELRKYQQDGLNWLSFLNKYKLHGILCDDMGLGKTLQSICIMAGDHRDRQQKYQATKQADCTPLPSIVVCPPTLTGHWVYEVDKFVSKEYLNPLHYTGPPGERIRLRSRVKRHNLVVASYDIVRNDIDFFSTIKWNYCILDEGHIIKNGKTKISKAVKQLSCNHRLILSGTPIQNNVLELWSLFDFLMPGFLGTERQFAARYGRPILQSRDAKSSSKEQEAGALAMEALHRQVLPFLLRRLKEDVLQDLPPKIIQDYYCDLSPLQVQLYEDFAKSRAKKSIDDDVSTEDGQDKKTPAPQTHIFQALQYLRKVCNHPALVLTTQHPEYSKVMMQLKLQKSTLKDINNSAKLTALRQLLQDCGIGVPTEGSSIDAPVVNQHRALVFCQLKSMLDIVEHDLLKPNMPSVTYLRLDGSVPAGNRHGIVNRFNNDPSIDVLLLTTHVGGLGLNLTGADTVIFIEHDWNPMKDLQAMDRAHRIGQKKVVNVYRLITRGTLEEKIMGLQKFKLNIANTVISQANSSLSSMGTDQLLDLFSLDNNTAKKEQNSGEQSKAAPTNIKNILENMEDLWDEKQYETEYDLGNFMTSLGK